jgi:hypothetical protein
MVSGRLLSRNAPAGPGFDSLLVSLGAPDDG